MSHVSGAGGKAFATGEIVTARRISDDREGFRLCRRSGAGAGFVCGDSATLTGHPQGVSSAPWRIAPFPP